MKYNEFIKANEGFQYSINIEYDLMNLAKVKGYIPTRDSIKILDQYLINVLTNNETKATVLISAYGKGKSHLSLILLNLLYGNKDKPELIELVEKIERIDKNIGQRARDVLENKKIMPVIVNSSSGDLNQAFMIALYKALKNEGIENIFPNTYFNVAVETIEQWRGYEDTISFFEKRVKEKTNLELDSFINKLKIFDKKNYEIFKEIFKEITSGIEFNAMSNADISNLYSEINYLIKENYGFDGMMIIFDEFSKFIEASTSTNNARDLKVLQDLAELCSRAKDPQMHLICITHKTINEYISKIPKEKIDAWRAIEGRFKEIFFNTVAEQNYELISNAIIKDKKKVQRILENNKDILKNHISRASRIFEYSNEQYDSKIIEGCFPLSPYTVYALPLLSEKVAQNERTLFTYLSKDEPNSLIDLIKNDIEAIEFITIDKLYDYFEPLLKKETFNEEIYKVWVKVNTALKIAYSENEKSIIKALGVFYLINDFSQLAPREGLIMDALNIDKSLFKTSVENLIEQGILILRKSTETLDFIPLTSVDINSKILNLVETKFKNLDYSKTIGEIVNLKYILPRKYNNEYKMTRFFKREFMTLNQIKAYKDMKSLLDHSNGDGIIVDCICFDETEIKELEKLISKNSESRVIFVLPKEILNIENDLREYKAIKQLRLDQEFLREDKAIESQLEILFEDLTEKIKNEIGEIFDLNNEYVEVTIKNQIYSKIKESKISEYISEICEEDFSKTPKINNELINKDNISSPIKKGRTFIIEKLLDGTYKNEDIIDCSKNSVEITLFRATIVNKGLLYEKNIEENIKYLRKEIKAFFKEANGKEKSFKELYENIIGDKKKIGMRKGSLPIYLAYELKDYKNEVILYIKSGRKNKEVNLDANILDNINEKPENYLIKFEEDTAEKEKYVQALVELFNIDFNRNISNKYVEIIKTMKQWYQELSTAAQKHLINPFDNSEISKELINFRNEIIKLDINPRRFIFEDILKYLKVDNYEDAIEKIKEIKLYLDNYEFNLRNLLIEKTNQIFDENYEGGLVGNLKRWSLTLNENQKNHLYDIAVNNFLKLINNLYYSDVETIDALANIFLNLSIVDWNDNSINEYLAEVKKAKRMIEDYELAVDLDSTEGVVKIVFESKENSTEKTFSRVDRTLLGSTLFNAIEEAMDEYGDAIEDSEKRNILIDILEKYI